MHVLAYLLAMQNYSSFYNGQVLRTLYKPTNLTVVTTMVNNTERIMLQSPGAAGTIYTAPMFACNVSLPLSEEMILLATLQDMQLNTVDTHVMLACIAMQLYEWL